LSLLAFPGNPALRVIESAARKTTGREIAQPPLWLVRSPHRPSVAQQQIPLKM